MLSLEGKKQTDQDMKLNIQVFRIRCVNQPAKEVDLRAIIMLISVKTNLCWGINGLDYQTKKHKYC